MVNALAHNRTNRGFTLVELLVALALTAFLIGGIILMYSSGRAATLESEQLSRMQENIRFASDFMVRDIRNAGFRDRKTLSVVAANEIAGNFAEIENGGNLLRIRYAGRGSCSEEFDDIFGVVVNEYFIDNGELRCTGNVEGNPEVMGVPISLVSGLTGAGFQFICPDGGSNCTCNAGGPFDIIDLAGGGLEALKNSCLGVRITLDFDGLRDLNNPGQFETRSVELTAAFRNLVLSRHNFLKSEELEG